MNETDLKKLELKLEALQAEIEDIRRIMVENEKIYTEIRKRLEDKKYGDL